MSDICIHGHGPDDAHVCGATYRDTCVENKNATSNSCRCGQMYRWQCGPTVCLRNWQHRKAAS